MKALTTYRPILLATTLAAAGMTPLPSQAVDPISMAQVFAIASTVISPITGVLSVVLDITKILGDYEGQKTLVRTKDYQDNLAWSYRGSQIHRSRREWMVGDFGPYFRTDEWHFLADGRVTYRHDSDPFPHAMEQRTYSCTTGDGMNVNMSSSVALQICYDVVRYSSLSYFIGPDPMPVTVRWSGHYLTESCLDSPKGGFVMTRERFAPRQAWANLSLPNSKSMEIIDVNLTPHK